MKRVIKQHQCTTIDIEMVKEEDTVVLVSNNSLYKLHKIREHWSFIKLTGGTYYYGGVHESRLSALKYCLYNDREVYVLDSLKELADLII